MKKLLLFMICSVLLFECEQQDNNKHKNITLLKISEHKIPVSKDQPVFPYQAKLFNHKLRFINWKKQSILCWDLNKEKYLDTLDIRLHRSQYVQNFNYINEDSILLSFNSVYFLNYHDHCVLLMDSKKNIYSFFSFLNAPVLLQTGNESISKNRFSFIDYTYTPLNIINKKYTIASFAHYKNKFCDSIIFDDHDAMLGLISSDSLEPFKQIPVKFNCPGSNLFYPWNMEIPRVCYNKNKNLIVSSFGNISNLSIYNIPDSSLTNKYVNFQLIDTILPELKPYKEYFDYNKPEYLEIIYNEKLREYFWIARLPSENVLFHHYPLHTYVILNEQFNKIGEGILKPGLQSPIVPIDSGFLIFNKQRSDSIHEIIFEEYQTCFTNKKPVNLEKKVKTILSSHQAKLDKLEYLNNFSSTKHYIIYNISRMCNSCLHSFTNKLRQQLLNESINNVTIVLLANDRQEINNYLNNYYLDKYKHLFYFDQNNMFFNYFEPTGYIIHLVVSNDKIILEETIGTNKINHLIQEISEDD